MGNVLGYESKKILSTVEARNVKQLIDALMSAAFDGGGDQEVIYTENGDVDCVTVRLIENTLTDGSKTYDVRIS
jgi:hypothetical protein